MNTDLGHEREFREKMVETALQHATELACEELMKEVEIETEDVVFSKRHLDNMEKLFDSIGPKKKKRIQKKYLILVAVIVAIGCAAGVVGSNPKWMQHWTKTTDTNTEIRYVEQDTVYNTYSTEEVTLGYIPEGMELVEDRKDDAGVMLKFQKENKNFTVRLEKSSAVANLDTEQADVEKIRIHNLNAYLIQKNEIWYIKWFTEEYGYTLYGNLEKDELIKIAENIG